MLDETQLNSEISEAVDVTSTMAALNDTPRKLPVDALRTIQRHRELFIPPLIEAIRSATALAREGVLAERNDYFFALFLLTEFEAKEALPAILEAFTLPDDWPYKLYSDANYEVLPITLAVLAGDQPELVDGLIRDAQLGESLRSTAAESILVLARGGQITQATAAERLKSHLQFAIDTCDHLLGQQLVCIVGDLAEPSTRELANEVFDKLKIDPFLVRKEDIERDFRLAEMGDYGRYERTRTCIDDTVAELQAWAAFSEQPPRVPSPRSEWKVEEPDSYEAPQPIHVPAKVGRNETCPCGSGKKYKKCCGRHGGEGLRLTP